MELILGLKPMTQFDAAAQPMYDSFQAKPDLTPFTHLPAQVNLDERNSAGACGAADSAEMDFRDGRYGRRSAAERNHMASSVGPNIPCRRLSARHSSAARGPRQRLKSASERGARSLSDSPLQAPCSLPFRSTPCGSTDLDALGQEDVAEERQYDQRPVERGQRRETQPARNGRKRQPGAERHDDGGGDRQRPTGPALQEGDAVGANDVNDERLRQQRLDEPAGLEERCFV